MGWNYLGWPGISSGVSSIRSSLGFLETKVTTSLLENNGKVFCALLHFQISTVLSTPRVYKLQHCCNTWYCLYKAHEVQTPGLDSQSSCQPSYLTSISGMTSALPNIPRHLVAFHLNGTTHTLLLRQCPSPLLYLGKPDNAWMPTTLISYGLRATVAFVGKILVSRKGFIPT